MAKNIEDNDNAKQFWENLSDTTALGDETKRDLRNVLDAMGQAIILSAADAPPIYPHTITIDGGPFTDGTDPVEFPELHYDGQVNGRPSYAADGYSLQWDISAWILSEPGGAYWVNLEDVENPEAFEFPFEPDGAATGDPVITWAYLSADHVGQLCRQGDSGVYRWFVCEFVESILSDPVWREVFNLPEQLPIANGGTGATTARGAVTNLVDIENIASTTYTLTADDSGRILRFTAASDVTINLSGDLGEKFTARIIQAGAGRITIAPSGGATVNSYGATLTSIGQHANLQINRVAASTYNLSGDLSPVIQRAFLTSNFTRASGGGNVNIPGLTLPVVAGKTYRVKTFISVLATGGATMGSDVRTPALTSGRGINIRPGATFQYNFAGLGTFSSSANLNASSIVDGVIIPSASGNVTVDLTVLTSGSCDVLAGSYLELECLNP